MKSFSDLKSDLVDHLKTHALRTDGPFTLSSGGTSDWYLDGRQTTYSGEGSRLVARCVHAIADRSATAIGGLTMGADPVAIAAAVLAEPALKSFSVRKAAKGHGTGGRLVGPLAADDRAIVVDDTTTTGGSLIEAIEVLRDAGVDVVQAIVVVDRSRGEARRRVASFGVPFEAIVLPADLGVGE